MNQQVHAGRPRDARLNDALLQAGTEVFVERGYHAASLAEIARRARVGTPAIYRRWPTKADMAIEIVVRELRPEPIPHTGSLRGDLLEFVRLRLIQWRQPIIRRVMVPLMLEGVSDPAVTERVRAAFVDYRQLLVARLHVSVAAGELKPDVDPRQLLDMLSGPITISTLFAQELPPDGEAETLVARILDGFAARP